MRPPTIIDANTCRGMAVDVAWHWGKSVHVHLQGGRDGLSLQ